MNLIFIVTDTLRADYIGSYGNDWIKTPNIDALARQSVQFNNCYGEGLPTVQARRVFLTGRGILPFEDQKQYKGVHPPLPGWKALSDEDITLADFLKMKGYWRGMVTDLWHLFKPNMNFHRNFDTWDFIRGQEGDGWMCGPKNAVNWRDHVPERLVRFPEKPAPELLAYLHNTAWFRGEEDYFCARTMRSAVRWLENCRDRAPFFLYVDTFDPHEFFDPPKRYAEMYYDNYAFERPIWGYGLNMEAASEEDLPWIKGLYAGKVTQIDTWVGYLIDSIERLGLMEDTVIAFTSDHGTEFYEHGKICKSENQLYSTVTRLPLLIRVPGAQQHAGKQVDGLVSAEDIAPTLLRLIGQTPPEQATGMDLWKMASGEVDEIRDHLVTGYGRSGAIRTHDWMLHTHAQPNAKFKMKEGPVTPALFDLKNDPGETVDVKDQHPDVRQRLLDLALKVWPEAV
jgi:arylsulfatase A-like enzyme